MSTFVSVLILAAGESRRMGHPKLLLPLGNSTIIEQTIDNVLSSRVGELIVVVGNRSDKLMTKISKRPVKIVVNQQSQKGMSTSIISGLRSVSKESQGIMIVLADQPFVVAQIIDKLVEEFQKRDQSIIVPIYRGKRGHPVIFPIKYRNDLLRLEGDVGAREIMHKYAADVVEVPVETESINIDLDTQGDYEKVTTKNSTN